MGKEDIKKQNLSKIALKGSTYILFSILALKLGGLIFTAIIARMLLPELFGIYSLALSIVILVLTFTDLGINETFLRYVSESIGKKDEKLSRGYFKYLAKIKFLLIISVVILFVVFSKYISYNIYEKPLLFYPLILSSLYIIVESFRNFLSMFFTAKKDMKTPVFLDISIQTLKILFSILAILILTDSLKVSGIFMAFFFSSTFTLGIAFFILLKKDKNLMFGKTTSLDKSKINSYWKYMIFTSLSLTFFGAIDNLMLGRFVASEYIAYYRVSLSLVLTVSALFALSNFLLPIFTQIHKRRFDRGFHKTIRYVLILAIPATVGLIFIARHLIYLIYGKEYLLSMVSFYFLIPLVITAPLITLYSIIFQSKEKPQIVSKAILIALLTNVTLNLITIFLFLNRPLHIIAGIALSTTLSRIILLILLIINSKKQFNFSVKGLGLRKPFLSTLAMSLFLLFFNHYIDMNFFFGGVEIILAIGIYFGIMVLIKGITKEDFDLIKSLFKNNKS